MRSKHVFVMTMQIDGVHNISDDTDFINNADDNTHSELSLTDQPQTEIVEVQVDSRISEIVNSGFKKAWKK